MERLGKCRGVPWLSALGKRFFMTSLEVVAELHGSCV